MQAVKSRGLTLVSGVSLRSKQLKTSSTMKQEKKFMTFVNELNIGTLLRLPVVFNNPMFALCRLPTYVHRSSHAGFQRLAG